MASCTFLFNIIVTHIELPQVDNLDPKKLLVEISINNTTVPITASRINVTEFKDDSGTEFNVQPPALRQALNECGINVLVRYSDQIIGTGHMSFPESVIESITDDMQNLTHVDTCSFMRDGVAAGKLEILCQFLIKCSDQEKPGESSGRRDMDRSINQEDIMFIVSEPQRSPNPCDPCLDALSPDDDDYISLGIQNRTETPAPKFAETLKHSPVGDSVCSEIKNMAKECEQTVDSIFRRSGKPSPQYSLGDIKESYPPMPQAQEPLPIDEMINEKRFCRICRTNVSFLPKFATCPNCGVKPMPAIEKQPKPKKLTAHEILKEYLGQTPDVEKKQSSEDDESGCRCTCKLGKICAYHRVLKQCSEFYQEMKSRPPKKPTSDEEQMNTDDPTLKQEDSRLFLGRVFSELCDLNNITDIKKPADLDEECSQKPPEKSKRQIGGQAQADKKNCLFGKHKKPAKKNNEGFILKKAKPPEKSKRQIGGQAQADKKNCLFGKYKKPAKKNNEGFILKKAKEHPRLIGNSHKHCAKEVKRVSRRHGWDWSSSQEARKNGWQPGSIRKPIIKIMKFFLKHSPENNAKKLEEAALETEGQLPILQLCKKNGEIVITLRAKHNSNKRTDPIVYKLVKSDLAIALSEIKKNVKAQGFSKCTCHNTVMMCTCRHYLDKKHLEYAVQKESKRLHIENCVDHLVLTDTSDSEMEFDIGVGPPADLPKIPYPDKYRTVNNYTQFDKNDLKVTSKYPVPPDPYWRAYDCAAGDRYTGTAFGSPGEAVLEDGVFGHEGGGPHGPSASPGGKTKPPGVWGSSAGGPMRGGGRAGPDGIGGGGRSGPGGLGGGPGGKGFPGSGSGKQKSGPSPIIPVKMPKRYVEGLKKEAQAKKDAIQAEIKRKKKGIDAMGYLMKKGIVKTPWDPNNPQPKDQPKDQPTKTGPAVGPDGLTDAQRKRRELNQMCIPPLDSMPRLGKGIDPCRCYDLCGGPQCCYPCCYW